MKKYNEAILNGLGYRFMTDNEISKAESKPYYRRSVSNIVRLENDRLIDDGLNFNQITPTDVSCDENNHMCIRLTKINLVIDCYLNQYNEEFIFKISRLDRSSSETSFEFQIVFNVDHTLNATVFNITVSHKNHAVFPLRICQFVDHASYDYGDPASSSVFDHKIEGGTIPMDKWTAKDYYEIIIEYLKRIYTDPIERLSIMNGMHILSPGLKLCIDDGLHSIECVRIGCFRQKLYSFNCLPICKDCLNNFSRKISELTGQLSSLKNNSEITDVRQVIAEIEEEIARFNHMRNEFLKENSGYQKEKIGQF